MEALQWAIGILVTIQLVVTGFLANWLRAHIEEWNEAQQTSGEKLARIGADVERMKEDIGTHDTGMRGHIHEIAKIVQEHELTILDLRRKNDRDNRG